MSVETATTRLSRALEAGDAATARREFELADDRDRRDDLLDLVARRAATGGGWPLELLIEVTDELGLAQRAVHRVLVDEDAVDDVAQDTLIAVATSIAGFEGRSRYTTWLHGIARRRAIDHLRRERATVPLEDHDVGEAERLSSVVASMATARQLVDRLPEPYRAAVQLRELDRLSYADAAARLDRNVATLRSHVARGRALLARMLDEGSGG